LKPMHALILLTLLAVTPGEIQAVTADRARQAGEFPGNLVYFSTSHLDGEQRVAVGNTLKSRIAATSRQQIIEKCTPVQISETLYRVNLTNLDWDYRLFFPVVAKHPYYGSKYYIYHADWFVTQISDTTKSDAYYRLLLGKADPNRGDFLNLLGVNNDVTYHFGIITRSKSPLGPAVAGLRFVENRPTNQRTSFWTTRDSSVINAKSDPLEHLQNDFKHEAEEHIGNLPKQSLSTGERGALMAFFLSDAKGKRQEEAPPSIVTDHLGFRNQNAIRNVGSCIGCHATGYLPPGESELRTYITNGLNVYAKPKEVQEFIERFHLSDAGKQLTRDNEDLAIGLRLCNGLGGEENYEAFRATFDYYDADLTLETAAQEVHTTAATLRLAIAYANTTGQNLGARLPALVHNGVISRASWEDYGYKTALYALADWGKSK
jgi:hypothetical protein